ncbi:MAG: pteridine reductase [Dechloromonas sp.]|nr:pteridine reductase [Dechloromonas sp.]
MTHLSSGPRLPVALITGAGRRVGAAIVQQLHDAGWRVAIHYRQSADAAVSLARALNQSRLGSAHPFMADLAQLDHIQGMLDSVVRHFGRLDALINNASSFFPTPVGEIDLAAWDDLVGSNLRAPLFLSQAAAPHLRVQQGCIVNITDIHAERPLRGFSAYCAAKGGLLNLTRALATDLAPAIRVNAVAPGAIAWPDDEVSFTAADREKIVAHTLLKRVGSPMDIARTVKFLVCDAPYITGQVINVDGGRTAHLSSD